jgi:hypothetical protein
MLIVATLPRMTPEYGNLFSDKVMRAQKGHGTLYGS